MLIFILIAFVTLILAAFALRLWQRTSLDRSSDREIAPPAFEGLFPATPEASSDAVAALSNRIAALTDRARRGDLEALSESSAAGDPVLYGEVMDALVEAASNSQEILSALVKHMSTSNAMRGNKRLAELLMEKWKANPDAPSTAEMLHGAALSDDAAAYERAVEAASSLWHSGRLPRLSAGELVDLVESQYWILAPEARRGGAGFALKTRLAELRRELATATRTS